MLRTQQISLFIILLAGVAICQRTITITCRNNCGTQCSFKSCYDIVGSGYNETVCGGQKTFCTASGPRSMTLSNCSYDFQSSSCSTGLCVSAINQTFAVQLASPQSCVQPFTRVFRCGACTTITCASSLCQSVTQGAFSTGQSCVVGCPSVSTTTAIYGQCGSGFDSVGTTSNCCLYFTSTAGSVCTSQLLLLQAKNLAAWAKPAATTFEYNVSKVLVIALLVCLSILIA